MNKKVIVTVVIIIVVLLAGAIGFLLYQQSTIPTPESTNGTNQTEPAPSNGSTAPDTPVSSDATEVEISDFTYTPGDITVEQGTTITWTNQDEAQHNVVAVDADNTGGLPTSAPLLSQGESYSFTFEEVGTFEYLCEIHPQMRGTVTVTE